MARTAPQVAWDYNQSHALPLFSIPERKRSTYSNSIPGMPIVELVYMSGLVLLKGIESRHLQAASPVSSSFDGDGGSRSKGSPKVSPNTTSDKSNLGVL